VATVFSCPMRVLTLHESTGGGGEAPDFKKAGDRKSWIKWQGFQWGEKRCRRYAKRPGGEGKMGRRGRVLGRGSVSVKLQGGRGDCAHGASLNRKKSHVKIEQVKRTGVSNNLPAVFNTGKKNTRGSGQKKNIQTSESQKPPVGRGLIPMEKTQHEEETSKLIINHRGRAGEWETPPNGYISLKKGLICSTFLR